MDIIKLIYLYTIFDGFVFINLFSIGTAFQVPETKHGGIGLYQCKDGYKLEGANTTECRYGNWTNTTPRCKEVYCKFPGTIENGKVNCNCERYIVQLLILVYSFY